jgi:hypothetical protein
MIVEAGLALLAIGAAVKIIQGPRRRGTSMPRQPTGSSQPSPAGPSPVTIANRVMRGPTGATYTLTDDDLLWLARAIKGETGTHAEGGVAVAWALAQNFLCVGANPPRTATFGALIRAYCQPLSPQWADPNSAKCRAHPDRCTPPMIRRRLEHINMPWASIPQSVRDIVAHFAAGSIPNPIPGRMDWRNSKWRADAIDIGGNWFARDPGRRYATPRPA